MASRNVILDYALHLKSIIFTLYIKKMGVIVLTELNDRQRRMVLLFFANDYAMHIHVYTTLHK